MGQYYLTVNLDKHEYIMPHRFGDGLKLLEFGSSRFGTLSALALLLADGNGRGGGDLCMTVTDKEGQRDFSPWFEDVPGCLRIEHEFVISGTNYRTLVPKIVGQWSGDRIVVTGDYADEEKFLSPIQVEEFQEKMDSNDKPNLYGVACEFFEDISHDVMLAMAFEPWYLPNILEALSRDATSVMGYGNQDVRNSAQNTLKQIKDLFDLTDEKVAEILAKLKEDNEKRYAALRPDMVVVARKEVEQDGENN